jgi:adenylate cyclase
LVALSVDWQLALRLQDIYAARAKSWSGSRLLLAAFLIAQAVFLCVLGVRAVGGLQALELLTYDGYLGWRVADGQPDNDILIVAITDADLTGGDTTVPDAVLATALERLLEGRPAAIGLDLLRASPVPPGGPDLDRVLSEHPEIIVTAGYADRHEPARATRAAPPIVTDPERIGFADADLDADGVLRRGLLYLTGGDRPGTSLALRLAERYLAARGIFPEPDGRYLRLGATTYVPLDMDGGGYSGQAPGGYQLLLSYAACGRGLPTVSIGTLLSTSSPAERLEGRIVLLGNQASDAKDLFKIPVECVGGTERQMYGVAVHGHTVAQLIGQARGEERPIQTLGQVFRDAHLGQVAEAGWIWLWTLAAGLAAAGLRSISSLTAAGLLGTTALVASTLAPFIAFGWWVPVVPPALGAIAASMLSLGYALTRERQRWAILLDNFAAYVSERVADLILRGRSKPQELIATVLFSDIRGFTTISEQLPEKILMAWLNEYMAVMADLVLTYGGVIEKFAGDGLTAEFGVPEPRTTAVEVAADARAAVACALAMGEALIGLNLDWRARGLPEIAIRVGIHTGSLIVGDLGSARRKQYSIIGDTANTAARLESYGKDDPLLNRDGDHCRILISSTTLGHLERDYETAPVGTLKLKGKARTVEVHQVLGRRASRAQAEQRG